MLHIMHLLVYKKFTITAQTDLWLALQSHVCQAFNLQIDCNGLRLVLDRYSSGQCANVDC